MARKEVKGGSGILTLAAGITNVSASCTANGTVSGWPTGASWPFVIAIAPGTASEEKILCSALSGSAPCTINFTTRGFDGTSAQAHNVNDSVEHILDADTINDLFAHTYDTTRDDHTQYVRVDGTRAFSAVTAIAGTPVSVGASNAAGTALTFARSDHVHRSHVVGTYNGVTVGGGPSSLTVAHGCPFTPSAVMIESSIVDAGNPWHVTTIDATNFVIQSDGSARTCTGRFVAFP